MILIVTIITLICIGIFSGLGVGGAVIIGLTLFFSMVIFMPVFAYFIPASFYVVIRDNLFIYTAMGKVRQYLSGNFWWTWLIMIVSVICLGILQGLFSLPASIMMMTKLFSRGQESGGDSSVLLMVLYTLAMFLTYCTYSILQIVAAFNFMSHEEKYEGKGLQSKIEEII